MYWSLWGASHQREKEFPTVQLKSPLCWKMELYMKVMPCLSRREIDQLHTYKVSILIEPWFYLQIRDGGELLDLDRIHNGRTDSSQEPNAQLKVKVKSRPQTQGLTTTGDFMMRIESPIVLNDRGGSRISWRRNKQPSWRGRQPCIFVNISKTS